jgi:very-short-patch-repair endonuclease
LKPILSLPLWGGQGWGHSHMQHQATPTAQRNARILRRGMTDSERKLWSHLRGNGLGVRFRRQHPLGSYVADFACLDPKLVIELDGSQHAADAAYDQRRDAFFHAQGFAVLRFSTDAPLRNAEGVLTVILEQLTALAGAAAPIPAFPQRGKEMNTRSNP